MLILDERLVVGVGPAMQDCGGDEAGVMVGPGEFVGRQSAVKGVVVIGGQAHADVDGAIRSKAEIFNHDLARGGFSGDEDFAEPGVAIHKAVVLRQGEFKRTGLVRAGGFAPELGIVKLCNPPGPNPLAGGACFCGRCGSGYDASNRGDEEESEEDSAENRAYDQVLRPIAQLDVL